MAEGLFFYELGKIIWKATFIVSMPGASLEASCLEIAGAEMVALEQLHTQIVILVLEMKQYYFVGVEFVFRITGLQRRPRMIH